VPGLNTAERGRTQLPDAGPVDCASGQWSSATARLAYHARYGHADVAVSVAWSGLVLCRCGSKRLLLISAWPAYRLTPVRVWHQHHPRPLASGTGATLALPTLLFRRFHDLTSLRYLSCRSAPDVYFRIQHVSALRGLAGRRVQF
jgi:hypothetical protein